MTWRFSRNNRSSNNPYGNDNRNDNSRNDINRNDININSRYQKWANRNRPQLQNQDETGYTTTEARYVPDTRSIIPHSRTPYSYHHSEQESERPRCGYRVSGPYDDETHYMRTYYPYHYDDQHSPGPSNYQQYSNQLQYNTQYPHHTNHDHRMGDQRQSEHREPRYSGKLRYGGSQPQQSSSCHTEQPRYSNGTTGPLLVFPQMNRSRVTCPTKSSLRQPRDDQEKDRMKKKVTFKKRATTRKISPEPEKRWYNLFRKKKQPVKERGPTLSEYLGANKEWEWY